MATSIILPREPEMLLSLEAMAWRGLIILILAGSAIALFATAFLYRTAGLAAVACFFVVSLGVQVAMAVPRAETVGWYLFAAWTWTYVTLAGVFVPVWVFRYVAVGSRAP
jgi:hypothetical protein